MFTQKRAWLIVLGVASIGFLAIWIAKLYIPLLQPIDPYSDLDTTLWLHALIFLPFLFVFGLFLFTTAINKFPKIATFLGVWVIYAPLTMAIVNAMAGIMFFPIFFLLWPLIESLIEFSDWLGLTGLAAEYFFGSAVVESVVVPALIALGFAITVVGLAQIVVARRKKRLVTDGLYATMRHPQHLGIALWTLGFTLGLPSSVHFFAWFTLVYVLVLLAMSEEGKLEKQFGAEYVSYQGSVPFIIPLVPARGPLLAIKGWRKVAVLAGVYIVGFAIIIGLYLL